MKQYWLSICIPSYNRGMDLYNKITKILDDKDDDIQVVVTDNLSTDNTMDLLKKIKHPDFKLLQNEINKKPVYNFVQSLLEGDGEYVLSLLDKDTIDATRLKKLHGMINKYKLNLAYISPNSKPIEEIKELVRCIVYSKVKDKLCNIAWKMQHPSGFLFKREELHKIQNIDWYIDNTNVLEYPHDFLTAAVSLNEGNASQIKYPLITIYPRILEEPKSIAFGKRGGARYYEPSYLYELMIREMKYTNDCKLSEKDRLSVIRSIYKKYWFDTIVMYYHRMKNVWWCDHYGEELRILSAKERLTIGRNMRDNFLTQGIEEVKCQRNNIWFKTYSDIELIKLWGWCIIKKILGRA